MCWLRPVEDASPASGQAAERIFERENIRGLDLGEV